MPSHLDNNERPTPLYVATEIVSTGQIPGSEYGADIPEATVQILDLTWRIEGDKIHTRYGGIEVVQTGWYYVCDTGSGLIMEAHESLLRVATSEELHYFVRTSKLLDKELVDTKLEEGAKGELLDRRRFTGQELEIIKAVTKMLGIEFPEDCGDPDCAIHGGDDDDDKG